MSIHVRNWEKFQHADVAKNKLRAPSWIRLYTELMSDEAYLSLTPNRRAMLVGIWLEYARTRRALPDDTASLSRRLHQRVMSADLQAIETLGFIEIRHDSVKTTVTTLSSLEESRGEVPAKAGTPTHRKDELWDSLLRAMGRDPETTLEQRRWALALNEIRATGATPDDVETRAAAYRREWPDVELTPHGLAANWSRFAQTLVTVLRPHECPECFLRFTTEAKLQDHLANVHDRSVDAA